MIMYENYENEPLTLMKLENLLDQQGLFSKILSLKDIISNGILDFVAHTHSQDQQTKKLIFKRGGMKSPRNGQELEDSSDEEGLDQFLLLAEFEGKSI